MNINDKSGPQMAAGIVCMLLSIGWIYVLALAVRLGAWIDESATAALLRHLKRIGARR